MLYNVVFSRFKSTKWTKNWKIFTYFRILSWAIKQKQNMKCGINNSMKIKRPKSIVWIFKFDERERKQLLSAHISRHNAETSRNEMKNALAPWQIYSHEKKIVYYNMREMTNLDWLYCVCSLMFAHRFVELLLAINDFF